MTKWPFIAALVLSNAIWAVLFFGQQLSVGYQESHLKTQQLLNAQLRGLVRSVQHRPFSRVTVIEAVRLNNALDAYDNGRVVQIGPLALAFESGDTIVKVVE